MVPRACKVLKDQVVLLVLVVKPVLLDLQVIAVHREAPARRDSPGPKVLQATRDQQGP